MQTKVLLSIKPEFAEKILSGEKRYEFRRTLFRSLSVEKIIIYVSSPVKKVVGEFIIDDILSLEIKELWNKTKADAGISKEYFFQYFSNKEFGYAIKVKYVRKYSKELRIEDFGFTHPPQSFCYIKRGLEDL